MALIRREDVWALAGDHVMTVRPGSKLEWVIHHYVNAIDGAPEVDAVPVVHGRWGENGDCSECGFQPWYELDIHTLSYCPNCGAKMDGERRDGE